MKVEIIEVKVVNVTSYEQSLRLLKAGYRLPNPDCYWDVKNKTRVNSTSVIFSIGDKQYTFSDAEESNVLVEVIPAYRLDKLLPESDVEEMITNTVNRIIKQKK